MASQDAQYMCPNAATCKNHCNRAFTIAPPHAGSEHAANKILTPTQQTKAGLKLWQRLSIALLATSLAALGGLQKSEAQEDLTLVSKGDAIVTGFSGTREDASVPGNVHPLDRTFIDGDGASLKVLDINALGNAPTGKLVDAPIKFSVSAKDIGQVFATTLMPRAANDGVDILAAATSFYGLHIVKTTDAGSAQRMLKGGPGATWMPGQFSALSNGGPGSIWKLDGTTGDVSLFASVTSNGKPNAGPGIGGLAFDTTHTQVFASNLETGFIHRFDAAGRNIGQFDHGETALWGVGRRAAPFRAGDRVEITDTAFDSENPDTWGLAAKARRVVALTRHKDRLFYSVAEGPEVWSVGIAADGSFASDARLEINLNGIPSEAPITKIVFDGNATLYLSQRGATVGSYDYSVFAKPDTAAVLRYRWDDVKQDWAAAPDEIAVGLKQPYRSSDGGIALGYGYDQSGGMQFGQCATTLWSTGSNLRDGDDESRVRNGGQRFVSGLQGVNKSSGAPLNASEPLTGSGALQGVVDYFFGGSDTAPWDSWFIAYGEENQQTRRLGHSGDVAIYAPCQAVAELADPPIDVPIGPIDIPDFEVPPGTPVVTIDKVCQPGGLGSVVACTITLTNTGTETPEWPIVFSDVSTLIAGPGAGSVTDITSATPDGLDWFCTPTPTPDFACALPGPALPPGSTRSVTVRLDTAGLVNAGNFGFKNCATLAWPHVGQACAEGGRALTFEKTGPAIAVATGDATYTLKISNTGTLPFNGNVLLTDRLYIAGAPVAVPIAAMNPDPQCVGGPPATVPFSCIAPLSLAAGGATSFDITVTLPADPAGAGYWVHNCFSVTDPAFGPPPGPPGPGAGQSCVWTEVLPTNVASNIRVDKTALNGAKCQKAGGDAIECDYEITLTNEGPVAFSDFVTLNETVPANATLTSGDPGLVCGGAAPDYLCNTGGSVDLVNGASISFPMKLTMSLPNLEAQGCEMVNTVKLAAPAGGTQANFKVTDDEASASADAFLQWWVGGMLFITCDPTNIKTENVAKGPCIKKGNAWRCDYDVTLSNLGPDPLTSVIKLDQTFSATPTALTFDAAWTCSGGGTNYKCEHPALHLPKGATLKFSVSAEVPDKGLCSLKSTADLTFPIAGTRGNSNGSDDRASAVAKINSKSCIKPLPEIDPIYPIVDPVPTCPDGSKRRANGRCPCPQGETWSRYDRACVPKQCFDPDRRKPNGSCCPRGTIWNRAYGACTKSCPDGQRWHPKKQRCISIYDCPRGTHWNSKVRRCVPDVSCGRYQRWSWSRLKCVPLTCKQIETRKLPLPDRCQEKVQCGKNEDLRKGQCVCISGYIRHKGQCVRKKRCRVNNAHYDYDQRRCVCDAGFRRDKRRCVPDVVIDPPPPPPPPQCRGKYETKNRYGQCVCISGYKRRNGLCVPKTSDRLCPDGKPVPRSGKCTCGYMKVWNAKLWKCENRNPTACRANDAKCFCKLRGGTWRRGKCRMPDSAADKCRKKGGKWKNGLCLPKVSDKVKCKLQGKKWKNGRCIDKITTPIYCPNGLPKPKNGRCPPTGPSAKEKCLKKGGKWKNGKCKTKPSAKLLCALQGKVWKNGRCQAKGPSAKQKCRAKGWKWTNGTCKPKTSQKMLCKLQGKVWVNGACRNKPKVRPLPTPKKKKPPVYKLQKPNPKLFKPQNLQQKWQQKKRKQSQLR